MLWLQKLTKLKYLAQNWVTWPTFPKKLLQGTNPGTKKSQELKPKSGTKSSVSETKKRTLSLGNLAGFKPGMIHSLLNKVVRRNQTR